MLGWKWQKGTEPTYGGTNNIPRGWINPKTNRCQLTTPDYAHDLNACHEMEKALKGAAIHSYFDRLVGEIAGSCSNPRHDDYPKVISATAAQRCEAFLRTIGKWKEPSCSPKTG